MTYTPSPDLEWIVAYLPMAETIAVRYGAAYGRYWEDVRQEIMLDLCERSAAFPTEKRGDGPLLRVMMERRAAEYCKGERNREAYLNDQFAYSPDEVRAMLPDLFADREHWASVDPTTEPYIPHAAGEGIAELLDIERGYSALPAHLQSALWARFADGHIGDGAARKDVTRAIDALTERINGLA